MNCSILQRHIVVHGSLFRCLARLPRLDNSRADAWFGSSTSSSSGPFPPFFCLSKILFNSFFTCRVISAIITKLIPIPEIIKLSLFSMDLTESLSLLLVSNAPVLAPMKQYSSMRGKEATFAKTKCDNSMDVVPHMYETGPRGKTGVK